MQKAMAEDQALQSSIGKDMKKFLSLKLLRSFPLLLRNLG
jgi:hypothetical protein